MTELLVAIATFLCLIGAAYIGVFCNAHFAPRKLPEGAREIVETMANIFLVTTSVVLGLMLNSAKTTLETNTGNVHSLANEIILLDRTIRGIGPEAEETHRRLIEYVQTSIEEPHVLEADSRAEVALDRAGASLMSIPAQEGRKLAQWSDARQLYRQVVRERWLVVDGPEKAIPTPLVVTLIAWLAVIFASVGFRAPRHEVVATTFVVAALLLAGTVYLILELDAPASGLMEVSNAPLQRALEVLQRPPLTP